MLDAFLTKLLLYFSRCIYAAAELTFIAGKSACVGVTKKKVDRHDEEDYMKNFMPWHHDLAPHTIGVRVSV